MSDLLRVFSFCALLFGVTAVAAASPPAQVVIVGTYHFSNHNADMHNVAAVDVLATERQAELQAITDSLSGFKPNVVAVEWPADVTSERYAQYLQGSLKPTPNEVVQLGFRLARQQGLKQVAGIDIDGEFPFAPVQAWAAANGRGEQLGALMQRVEQMVNRVTAMQSGHSLGQVLREFNEPALIEAGHGIYAEMLRYGHGDEQPGAALNAAWAARNLGICARLLQQLGPGDRAVVFYGQGHAHLLRRCVIEAPGVELVEANDFLPR